jgi:hypothetical protein
MAGYVGTKAVLLSTTAANVGGDADIGGALDVGGAFTSQGIDDNANATAITIDSSENVGIGDSSPNAPLVVNVATNANLAVQNTSGALQLQGINDAKNAFTSIDIAGNPIKFSPNASEAMRLDASGNLLVGKTSASSGTQGILLEGGTGQVVATATSNFALYANRLSTDGELARFQKDGSSVGNIGVASGRLYIANGSGTAGLGFWGGQAIYPSNADGSYSDNDQDLGISSVRFNDAYITNGVTTGSDGNDKQDIRDLTETEQRVAVACKGLLKAWRWKSAVEEKGDDARIHCGIIAQDLQAAFAAEGLDAGRYAMFMSNTWWEHDVEVPAVEAVAEVLDEEGNVVTEAVEAVDAYTRTDTYDTQEEAPEGATERTRLGVRYSELLAFIIGAL